MSATSGLLPPAGHSTLLPAALIPSPCRQCNPTRAFQAPLGFGSAAPTACHPPARLPPSPLAAVARLLPRSADLHHPEICRSHSRACPWHRRQHPSSLLLCLRAAASTAQPSAASPGADVPTRWRVASLPSPAPASLPSFRHAKAHGLAPQCLVHFAALCWARSLCLLPSSNTHLHLPSQPVFLTCITFSSYLLVLALVSASCPLPSTPPALLPTSFPSLAGGCIGLSLLGVGSVGAGWDPGTPTPPALARRPLHGAPAAPCPVPRAERSAWRCPRCPGLSALQPRKAQPELG